MIKIQQSSTADSRTCDYTKVTKEQLLKSSEQHIRDVAMGLGFFIEKLREAGEWHDFDKLSNIDEFHSDFKDGFESRDWYENHIRVNRHHLLEEKGIPEDVNLIDVIEMITDSVMAGMGRKGEVYPMDIDPDVLMKAFCNTADLLKSQIVVEKDK